MTQSLTPTRSLTRPYINPAGLAALTQASPNDANKLHRDDALSSDSDPTAPPLRRRRHGGRAAVPRGAALHQLGGGAVPAAAASVGRGRGVLAARGGARGHDAGRVVPARHHGGRALRAAPRVVPGVHPLPLHRLRLPQVQGDGGGAGGHGARVVPVAGVPCLPVRRRGPRGGAHLHLHPRRAGPPAQLRAVLPRLHASPLRAPRRVPRLRRRAHRRHRVPRRDPAPGGGGDGRGGAAVLRRQLHRLLHAGVLGVPRAVLHLRGPPRLLLQHGRHGAGPRAVAPRGLHGADRGVDGAAEARAHLRAWLAAAVPARVRRPDRVRGPPMEPARPRRGQLPRPLPRPARRRRQPAALERQGEALGPPGCRKALPARRRLGQVRPAPAGRRHRELVTTHNGVRSS